MLESQIPSHVAQELCGIGRRFYVRGWVLGTAGNFSATLRQNPVELAMTASSVNKGTLSPEQILRVDGYGQAHAAANTSYKPSAESLLHVELVQRRGAGSVLHTHSVWATILSDLFASRGRMEVEGYEMLKGLAGNTTHQTRELIPVLDNDQDMSRLSRVLSQALDEYPGCHAVLLRRHGLYTWGASLDEAERHVEILEFLFETVGRSLSLRQQEITYGTLENT